MNRPLEHDEPLDPRLERLSQGEVPADVQTRAHAALAGLRENMDRVEKHKESLIMKIFIANRWVRLGWAGSLTAIVLLVYMMLGPKGSSVAFAEVAAKLRAFKTMVYTGVMVIDPKADDDFTKRLRKMPQFFTTSKVSVKEPGLMRTDAMGGMTYTVMDIKNKKGISVVPLMKMGFEIDLSSISDEQMGKEKRFFESTEQFRKLPDRADKVLGEKEFDGRKFYGFHVNEMGYEMDVWVDPISGDPGRIEMRIPETPGMTVVMKDFKIDVPLDDSLFNMNLPKDYTKIAMKIEMPTEQDLVSLLRDWTDADPKHEFPETFTTFTMMKVPKKMEEKYNKIFEEKFRKGEPAAKPPMGESNDAVTTKQLAENFTRAMNVFKSDGGKNQMGEVMQDMMKLMKPFQFPMYVQGRGGEWHYAGKGVKLGEARPVCWWKQKKSDTTWRVIYGDLTIGDMPQDDMTKFLNKIKQIDTQTSTTVGHFR